MKDERNLPEGENEGLHYQNGQSDVEKLMRHHLQTPGHVISDEELKNLKVGVSEESAHINEEESQKSNDDDIDGFGEKQEGDAKGSTWDVLGS